MISARCLRCYYCYMMLYKHYSNPFDSTQSASQSAASLRMSPSKAPGTGIQLSEVSVTLHTVAAVNLLHCLKFSLCCGIMVFFFSILSCPDVTLRSNYYTMYNQDLMRSDDTTVEQIATDTQQLKISSRRNSSINSNDEDWPNSIQNNTMQDNNNNTNSANLSSMTSQRRMAPDAQVFTVHIGLEQSHADYKLDR
jgi:hypothetical protein